MLAPLPLDLLVWVLAGDPKAPLRSGKQPAWINPLGHRTAPAPGWSRRSSFLTFRMDLAFASLGKTPFGEEGDGAFPLQDSIPGERHRRTLQSHPEPGLLLSLVAAAQPPAPGSPPGVEAEEGGKSQS